MLYCIRLRSNIKRMASIYLIIIIRIIIKKIAFMLKYKNYKVANENLLFSKC